MAARASVGDPPGSDPDNALSVRGLVKRYGAKEAVKGIDLDVRAGEIFGFLGPNGAGKSTTIKMLCTLLTPDAGTASVVGFDVRRQRDDVRCNIGLVFQEPTLDTYLTAEQNLRFHAELYGVPKSEVDDRIRMVLDMVGLTERRGGKVMMFSGGMKRRLEIARGFLHSPRVLFLDEPTVGLDPQTRSSIWNYIKQLKETEEITIFMTTHYMDEAEYCDRIAVIDHGEIVVTGTPAELKSGIGKDKVQIQTSNAAAMVAALRDGFDLAATVDGETVTFSVEDGEQFVPELFGRVSVPIRSVSVTRPSLDDVFMAFTGRTIRDGEQADRNSWMRQAFLSGSR
jgi:ABC-2 type transport system ATP-binding protein